MRTNATTTGEGTAGPPENAVMSRLRVETRPLHDRAEATLLARALISGDRATTIAAYVAQLRVLGRFHGALEARLASAPSAAVACVRAERRDKAPLVEQDLDALDALDALGIVAPHAGLDAVDVWAGELGGRGRAPEELLGALYVLEGSGLGAAFLLPSLVARTGLPDGCFHYFQGYGADTGRRWKAFGRAMNAAVVSDVAVAAALDGARACFTAVLAAFDAAGPLVAASAISDGALPAGDLPAGELSPLASVA